MTNLPSLLNVCDDDLRFGDWSIPGTEITFHIFPHTIHGDFELLRSGIPDRELRDRVMNEIRGEVMNASSARRIGTIIQAIEFVRAYRPAGHGILPPSFECEVRFAPTVCKRCLRPAKIATDGSGDLFCGACGVWVTSP